MLGLLRFLSPLGPKLDSTKLFVTKLPRHCLYLKNDLISTGYSVPQPIDLDKPQGKNESRNPSDKDILELINKNSYISIGNDEKNPQILQNPKKKFLAKGKTLKVISELLENITLTRENTLQIVFIFHKILLYNNFSPIELNTFNNRTDIKKLFAAFEHHLHTFWCADVQSMLDICLICKLPLNDSLMQKTLVIALSKINQFLPINILSMYYHISIHEHEENESFKSFKLACLNYLKHCFKDRVDDSISLETLAYFFSKREMPLFLRNDLKDIVSEHHPKSYSANVILNLMKGIKQFSIESKTDLLFNERVRQSLKKLISSKSENFSPTMIVDFVYKYAIGVISKYYKYDEEMCDIFASFVVKGEWDLVIACEVMSNLSKVGHLNVSLRDYVLKKCQTTDFEMAIAERLLPIFSKIGFSQLDEYAKEYFVKKFQDFDFSSISLKTKFDLSGLLLLNLGLAVMGIYRKEMVDKAFEIITQQYENLKLSGRHPLILWRIIFLHQWVSLLHSNHENKLKEDVLNECYRCLVKKLGCLHWEKVIMDTFGTDYVLTGCETSLKHYLSYVVVLGPGNKPVNLSSYKTSAVPVNIETIQIPENSKMVLVQEVSNKLNEEFVNVPVQQEDYTLYLKLLESFGYSVVTLKQATLYELSDPFKKVFLISKLEDKFGKIDFDKN